MQLIRKRLTKFRHSIPKMLSFSLVAWLTACDSRGNAIKADCHSEQIHGQFVEIPSGTFVKSRQANRIEEGSPHEVHVQGFQIQTHEVSHAQFAQFVNASNYVTDAERVIEEGHVSGGSSIFSRDGSNQNSWIFSLTATWKMEHMNSKDKQEFDHYPVVHVSINDAKAYANWAGGRLPTENEWEYAASLGLFDLNRSDSGAYDSKRQPLANTWQGVFPFADSGDDGYLGIAPIACFPASKIGLYDMIGNVWEWTSTPYNKEQYTIKGGSHLCADNFCRRYRPAARQGMETNFSSNHIGFRIVKDVEIGDAGEIDKKTNPNI